MINAQELTLSVPDMSCEHCVKSIDGALTGLDGVEQVTVDLPTKTVALRYQPTTVSLQQIETALDDAGYTIAR